MYNLLNFLFFFLYRCWYKIIKMNNTPDKLFQGIIMLFDKFEFGRPEQNTPSHFLWKLVRIYKDAWYEKKFNLAIERLHDLTFWVEHMQSKHAQAVMSEPPGGELSLREFEESYAGIPVEDEDLNERRQQMAINTAERQKRFDMIGKRAKCANGIPATPSRRFSSYQTQSTPAQLKTRRATVPLPDVISSSERISSPLSPLGESVDTPEVLVARMHGAEEPTSVTFAPPQRSAPRAFNAMSPYHRCPAVKSSTFRNIFTPPITPKTPMPSPSFARSSDRRHRKTQTEAAPARKRRTSNSSDTSVEDLEVPPKKYRVSRRKASHKGMLFTKAGTILTCAWGDIRYLKHKYQARTDIVFGPVTHDRYNNEDIKLLWSRLCNDISSQCRKLTTRGSKKIDCNTIDYTKKAVKIIKIKLSEIGFKPLINELVEAPESIEGSSDSLNNDIDSNVDSSPINSVDSVQTEPVSVDIRPVSTETISVEPETQSIADEPTAPMEHELESVSVTDFLTNCVVSTMDTAEPPAPSMDTAEPDTVPSMDTDETNTLPIIV